MRTQIAVLALFTAVLSAAALPAQAANTPSMTQEMIFAQADGDPLPTPAPDPNTLTNPNDKHAVTPAEVAECMKSWDPQTGMSREEYEKSCKSTLKYFPEKGN